jgi:argininosuccinate lyase
MTSELIDNLNPSKKNMLKMANKGFTTATDFADYLVKEKKLTFRESYGISSRLVNYAEKNNKTLDEISLNELKKFHKNLDKSVLKIFDVKNSMNSKTSHGGTATINTIRMIKKYKKETK